MCKGPQPRLAVRSWQHCADALTGVFLATGRGCGFFLRHSGAVERPIMATATKSPKETKVKQRAKKVLDADQLIIRGEDGKPRIVLHAGKHSRSKHETGLIDFLSHTGKVAMRLMCERDWSHLIMYNEEDEAEVHICGGALGGTVSVHRVLRNGEGEVLSTGEVNISGDGRISAKGSHPVIEMNDEHGSTIFNARDEGAIEDYCYRVALCERGNFKPESAWDYPTSRGGNLGMTIKEFLDTQANFEEATAKADGYNKGVLDDPKALFAVVIPPGAAASVGGTVWCRGYVFGNHAS